jgi:hypothetical protein
MCSRLDQLKSRLKFFCVLKDWTIDSGLRTLHWMLIGAVAWLGGLLPYLAGARRV